MVTRSFPFGSRDSFATELLAGGYDVRTIQKLLGHESVETTTIYDRVVNDGPGPLEALQELFRNDLPA